MFGPGTQGFWISVSMVALLTTAFIIVGSASNATQILTTLTNALRVLP